MEHIKLVQTPQKGDARELSLDGDMGVYAEEAVGLRGYSPTVSLKGRHRIVSTPPRDIELPVKIRTPTGSAAYETLCDICSTSLTTPTRIEVDGWSQDIVVTAADVRSVTPTIREVTLGITLCTGYWYRLGETQRIGGNREPFVVFPHQGNAGLDYPYDYPYDYLSPPAPTQVTIDTTQRGDDVLLRIVWYAADEPPSLTLNGNTYAYNRTIPSDDYVTVDPLMHTVTRRTLNTEGATNVLRYAERGGGVNSGRYIFQPQTAAEPKLEVVACTPSLADITPIYRRIWL